jgi:prephenate dehydratase
MTISYQGAPGAFGHEACLAFAPTHRPVARPSFAAVVRAVAEGETELGLLPVENLYAGPVPGVRELLDSGGIAVVATHELPVRMHLLALPGATLEDIRTVVSHPMALAQCAETLRALGLATEQAANTALAAQALDSPAKAVLASKAAAEAYGLIVLRADVHDSPGNATRFCIFERRAAKAAA